MGPRLKGSRQNLLSYPGEYSGQENPRPIERNEYTTIYVEGSARGSENDLPSSNVHPRESTHGRNEDVTGIGKSSFEYPGKTFRQGRRQGSSRRPQRNLEDFEDSWLQHGSHSLLALSRKPSVARPVSSEGINPYEIFDKAPTYPSRFPTSASQRDQVYFESDDGRLQNAYNYHPSKHSPRASTSLADAESLGREVSKTQQPENDAVLKRPASSLPHGSEMSGIYGATGVSSYRTEKLESEARTSQRAPRNVQQEDNPRLSPPREEDASALKKSADDEGNSRSSETIAANDM